jgi:hypothetical protein
MSEEKLTDEQIQHYINSTLCENAIQFHENEILNVMKVHYENYPTEKNDLEWLNYTNFVCKRRCQN